MIYLDTPPLLRPVQVEGVPITANQEMVVRLTWLNEDARRKAFIMTAGFDPKTHPMSPVPKELEYVGHKLVKSTPEHYIGKVRALIFYPLNVCLFFFKRESFSYIIHPHFRLFPRFRAAPLFSRLTSYFSAGSV